MRTETFQWHYTARDDLGILALAGHLDDAAAGQFTGAVNWVLAHGAGPLILDLTALHTWSHAGQAAIVKAARRLAERGRPLELSAIPADGTAAVIYNGTPFIPVYHDLTSALAAHGASCDEPVSERQWRSGGWSDR
ncbi:STAS domain-containing protein [Actinacidiphila glaucinigra]|uniref:STAS domain-containing protein n=1 Tax=Actinacidiphila glaucinigra TaxID=235986 RepID=UPI002DD7C764|nr:STAS domain-containing protein [Actinacidiphila glaucinigra]WSD64947.1 STAS domain-containing protein [Actinacidiphila glaucinigra]